MPRVVVNSTLVRVAAFGRVQTGMMGELGCTFRVSRGMPRLP